MSEPIDQNQNIPSGVTEDACSICYMQLSDRSQLKLSCDHIFHDDCIEHVIMECNSNDRYTIPSCPLCRKVIVTTCLLCRREQIPYNLDKCLVCHFQGNDDDDIDSNHPCKYEKLRENIEKHIKKYKFLWGRNKLSFSFERLKEFKNKLEMMCNSD